MAILEQSLVAAAIWLFPVFATYYPEILDHCAIRIGQNLIAIYTGAVSWYMAATCESAFGK